MNIPTQGRPLAVAKEELLRAHDQQHLAEVNAMEREADFQHALEEANAKGTIPQEVFAIFMQMWKVMNVRPAQYPLPDPDEFEKQARQQAVYQYAPMYRSLEGDKETLIDFQAYVMDARSIEFDHAKGEAYIWFGSDEEPLIFKGASAVYLRKYLSSLGIFEALAAREVCPECGGSGYQPTMRDTAFDNCERCGQIGWVLDEAKIAPRSRS